MTILLVCADEQRLNQLKEAIQSAGFRTISARSVDDAWAKIHAYDVNGVVIDYELKNDIVASAFRHLFRTVAAWFYWIVPVEAGKNCDNFH